MKIDWRYLNVRISAAALRVMRANGWTFTQTGRHNKPCAYFDKNKSAAALGLVAFGDVIVAKDEVAWLPGADDPSGPPHISTVKPGVTFESPFEKY